MTIWFTSDEHHGHENLCRERFDRPADRPFSDATEMTEAIIQRHRLLVEEGDVTYHLGDFTWDQRNIADILRRMRGRHILVPGNHDRCHPCHKRHVRERTRYEAAGFVEVTDVRVTLATPIGRVLLTHMPRSGGPDARYREWRPDDWWSGGWIFCGHVHKAWKMKNQQINVGVDQWDFYPVSMEKLVQLAREGKDS